jgi:hypothetical protein
MDCSSLMAKLLEWSAVGRWVPIVTLFIAAVVAFATIGQLMVNNRKLRLDLYNRRFDIYSKSVNFYQALLRIPSKDGTQSERDCFNVTKNEFIKARLESQFLFAPKSGVYALLDEMKTRSSRMIAYQYILSPAFKPGTKEWEKNFNQNEEDLEWASGFIEKLGGAMARYLNFHRVYWLFL